MADRTPWQKRLTRAVRPLEALLVHGAFALFGMMRLETASSIGGRLGRIFGPWIGVTRRARRNLRRAFPEKSPVEIEAIIRDMWENLGRLATEYPHLSRMRASPPDQVIEIRGAEHVAAALARGKPLIFFAGHLANWEIGAIAARACGAPVHLIYRSANNPWVEEIFRKGRGDIAAGLVPKGADGARQAVKLLRNGEHLGILIDQKMNDGIPVPFFGRDAMTAPAPARLAMRFDCAFIPVQVERVEGARFRLTYHPPLRLQRGGDVQADALALTTEANACLENWIRQRPAQWLWVHQRWPD
jgi:KDO2-lipid IV(A) lauroyltransferase